MFKKLLASLAMAVTMTAQATEPVKLIWPFGPVAATNTFRNIIDQVNAGQSQFTFVLDHAPGGGGSVAVQTVTNSTAPALLAHSTAFFVNPKLANSNYNVNDFKMIKHICDLPFPIASVKYKSMKQLPTDKPITVGINGLGSTTHLVQQYFAQHYPNMVAVPYKSATAALTDILGGHLDMAVSLPGDVMAQYEAGKINVLGVTGSHSINGIPTFASQGYEYTDKLISGYFVFAHKKTDAATMAKWQQMFNNIDQKSLDAVSKQIYCTPSRTAIKDLDQEFVKNDAYWAYLTTKVRTVPKTLAQVDKVQK